MEQYQNYNNINQNNEFANQNLLFNQFNLMQMNPFLMNQFQNMMNQIVTDLNNDSKYIDVYDYIKEEKKRIIFRRVLDNKEFKVLIPKSIRNDELYSTSKKYRQFSYSEIQLYHKDTFLNNDDEYIDYIKDGDEVKIIEQIHEVDFRYYQKYLSKHKDEPKKIIQISLDGRQNLFLVTPNTSIEELGKIFFNQMKIPQNFWKNYSFRYNGEIIDIYDKSSISVKGIGELNNIINVNEICLYLGNPEGKIMEVIVMGKRDKEDYKIITNSNAGTLEKISNFYEKMSIFLGDGKSIIKMIINGRVFQKNDKSTFSSNGIRENFTCFIEFK